MGVIINGLLISTKKSAGGINFYKRLGQQCFRNKPQRSANYVSTPQQVAQQLVFGQVAALLQMNLNMSWVKRWGFKHGMKNPGQMPTNVITSMILSATSRDEAGQPLTTTERDDRRALLESDPMLFFAKYARVTGSSIASVDALITSGTGGSGLSVTVGAADVALAKSRIGGLDQRYVNALNPALVYMAGNDAAPADAVPTIIQGTPGLLGAMTYQLPIAAGTDVRVQYALVFFPGDEVPANLYGESYVTLPRIVTMDVTGA